MVTADDIGAAVEHHMPWSSIGGGTDEFWEDPRIVRYSSLGSSNRAKYTGDVATALINTLAAEDSEVWLASQQSRLSARLIRKEQAILLQHRRTARKQKKSIDGLRARYKLLGDDLWEEEKQKRAGKQREMKG